MDALQAKESNTEVELLQTAKSLISKCAVEEDRFDEAIGIANKLRRTPILLVAWFVLGIVAAFGASHNPIIWGMTAYLAVILCAAIYALLSMGSIKRLDIDVPSVRHDIDSRQSCSAAHIESLYEYYWALDKRNDRVSRTLTISGTVVGIGTAVFVVLVAVLLVLGRV